MRDRGKWVSDNRCKNCNNRHAVIRIGAKEIESEKKGEEREEEREEGKRERKGGERETERELCQSVCVRLPESSALLPEPV